MHASSNITGKKRNKQVSPRRARGNHGGKTETMPRQRSGPDNSRRNRCQRIRTRAGTENKDGVFPYLGFPSVEGPTKRRTMCTANKQCIHTVQTCIRLVQHTHPYITSTRYSTCPIGIPSRRASRRGSVEADVVVVVEVVVHAPVVEVEVHGLVDGSRTLGVGRRSSTSVDVHESVDVRGRRGVVVLAANLSRTHEGGDHARSDGNQRQRRHSYMSYDSDGSKLWHD